MKTMQESEFDKMEFDVPVEKCDHSDIVKLYQQATHTDYGCRSCGVKCMDLDLFKKCRKS